LGRLGKPQPIAPCWHYLAKNDPFYTAYRQPLLSKEPALVVRWLGAAELQLVRCDTDPVTEEIIQRAVRSVRAFERRKDAY